MVAPRDRRGGRCHLTSVKSQVCEGKSSGDCLGIGCSAAGMYLTGPRGALANGEDGKLDVVSILL